MLKELEVLNTQMRGTTLTFLFSATSERYYNTRQTCEAVTPINWTDCFDVKETVLKCRILIYN